MKKLIKNAIKCNHCGDIIESKHTHDFKWCSCETVAVDGGLSYCKRSFKNSPDDFTEMCEFEEVEEVEIVDYTIVSKPVYITFKCPYCGEDDIKIPFEEDFWHGGVVVECPSCKREVELGDGEYD